jgi:ribonucrease Y
MRSGKFPHCLEEVLPDNDCGGVCAVFLLIEIIYDSFRTGGFMELVVVILLAVVGLAVGFAVGWKFRVRAERNTVQSAEIRAKKILDDAEKEASTLKREKILEAKDEWYKKKQDFDADIARQRSKLQTQEKQVLSREQNLERKLELFLKKEKNLQELEQELQKKVKNAQRQEDQLNLLIKEQNSRLERITSMTVDEAKKMLYENLISDVKNDAAQYIREIRDQTRIDAKKEAQRITIQAIQRTAVDHSVETTVSVLNIQSDEMKGRIIGKEGRNIRAFEAATGVDVIVDDTPEAVILSAFDGFRREVAKNALERLISDGRIHPARIEEVVAKVREELEEEMIKIGENALIELSLHGVHNDLLRLLGKMKFRSSYGQNMLQHSIEVGFLTGFMAAELGLDAVHARRAGLLHDVGKVVERNVEGPHALIGYELAKKYNEHPAVANAIGSHHEDIPMETPLAVLVQAADAISGARPGARRESVEAYVKRLEKLEDLARSFKGVANSYAIQAGREIRVVVEPDKIDDILADQLSHDIAAKIQKEMEYPGQIKVTVIREVRSVALAK